MQNNETIWRNARVSTMDSRLDGGYGWLPELVDIWVEDGIIKAFLPVQKWDIPNSATVIDVAGNLVTPSLVDCHTHLVFGGNRALEWERRQNGESYQSISASGGGINTTVQATRNDSAQDLYQASVKRLRAMMHNGVGLIEIKTGYGLDLASERKILEVISQLKNHNAIEISATLLSAHTVPPEFKGRADEFIDEVINHIMPVLWEQKLFDCVDVFCENVGFSLEQTERVLAAAKQLGIPVKGHTEQLSLLGGSALIARYDGWSADHVEYLDEAGVQALARHDTVAVLLPGAFYFLRETQKPPVQMLREYGVKMAVSTDFNPGTSPLSSLLLAMNMACVQFGLTPLEAWQGVTVNAAHALRRSHDFGILAVGKAAHFNVWDSTNPVDMIYEQGRQFLKYRVLHGVYNELATN